jgi:hypothetical protein
MNLPNSMTAEELLATDFPDETAEEAYRRGYNDAMQVTIDYLTLGGIDAAWLERWRAAVISQWVTNDTDREVWPPLPDLWVETPNGFREVGSEDPNA